MDEPLVSIITPSYNQGQYIEETIKSVINQTYKNIEYIIMDGASKDDTIKILDKYKDFDNIKITVEKDNGQTDAINKGFKMAKGDLVGWINSDDLLELDCVENIVNEYVKRPRTAIFYGDVQLIDENGRNLSINRIKNITYDYLLNVNPDVNQQGSFYNRQYVKKINYLDDSINFTMDYDLWLRLLCIGEAVKLDKVVGKFRMQLNSKTMTSGNGIRFWKDIFRIRKTKHSSNINLISKLNIRFIKWCMFATLSRLGIKLNFK